MQPLRTTLKLETNAEHRQLDDLLSELQLETRKGLVQFLQMQEAAMSKIEPLLVQAKFRGPPSHLSLIRSDLQSLGVSKSVNFSVNYKPLHPVGLTYVIAGSHFGNKVLRAQWALSEDLAVLSAKNFLTSDLMRDYWPYFLSYLRDNDFDDAERTHIIESAKSCFQIFGAAYMSLEKAVS